MTVTLPDHLLPTRDLLTAAYPEGIPRGAYNPLVTVLREAGLSFRDVNAIVKFFAGEYYDTIYDEVLSFDANCNPMPQEVEAVRAALRPHGYDAWLAAMRG